MGEGLYAHPETDYQSQRNLQVPQDSETLTDQLRKFHGDKRTDPTDRNSGGGDENIFLAGNPDTFGPGLPLVREPKYRPSGSYPQPSYRTGVYREE